MKQDILTKIRNERTFFDGGMGTLLQSAGLALGELPERWNTEYPERIAKIHAQYLQAGADIIKTNTFGANRLKFSPKELSAVIRSGVSLARKAVEQAGHGYVALDVGPCGKLLKPYGDLDFEEAVDIFAEIVKIGREGCDCILIETMNDSYETKAAVLAAKENSALPVFATNVYGSDGKLMTGATPEAMIALLEGLGVDALGMNCSLGAEQMATLVPVFLQYASVPVIVNPNAGLPKEKNGSTVYDVGFEEFSDTMRKIAGEGAHILGGCCGTTPEFIRRTVEKTKEIPFCPPVAKEYTLVSSYTQAVYFSDRCVLVGERINPTGKKRFQQALREGDIDYILQEGLRQQDKGAEILDVNVGLPDIDERAMLSNVVRELQGICDLPLQLDTADPVALEEAMRLYNGKPMVNSVNGKSESMRAVFPLLKKYGGVVVALTLDEHGIPARAEERLAIAQKILSEAAKYGVRQKDVLFDPLAMAVSADKNAPNETLRALQLLKERGYKTSLGVSNVSFGLPAREAVNGVFFTLAMQNGLSAAILNVHSLEMQKAYRSFNALTGRDENCTNYIKFATEELPSVLPAPVKTQSVKKEETSLQGLSYAIERGLKEQAATLAAELLGSQDPLEVIDRQIIPALDSVGKRFENKQVFLPQLLMSAEAAQSAFSVIREHFAKSGTKREKRCAVVLATVKGDIHDIGKNIVKVLLENYGFDVYDLGKDVPPERIAEAAERTHAPLVGLSALMTTTVPSMAETVKLLRIRAPWCKIVVGGAVMTEEYARKIGADRYARDGMETVRYADKIERDGKKGL